MTYQEQYYQKKLARMEENDRELEIIEREFPRMVAKVIGLLVLGFAIAFVIRWIIG